MECRITRSDKPWECQIIIRWENDADGKKITSWEEPFGPVLYDRSELEEMIRRAQLAVLNPSVPVKDIVDLDTSTLDPEDDYKLPASLGSQRQFQFSESVVCLNLSGPDLTNLAFIDLPGTSPLLLSYVTSSLHAVGLIQNVKVGNDQGDIKAVWDMVSKHIGGNTLILLAITMRGKPNLVLSAALLFPYSLCMLYLDDIDNQGAVRLAQEADPNGDRTIGTFTLTACYYFLLTKC